MVYAATLSLSDELSLYFSQRGLSNQTNVLPLRKTAYLPLFRGNRFSSLRSLSLSLSLSLGRAVARVPMESRRILISPTTTTTATPNRSGRRTFTLSLSLSFLALKVETNDRFGNKSLRLYHLALELSPSVPSSSYLSSASLTQLGRGTFSFDARPKVA